MIVKKLTNAELEAAYDQLAEAIDAVPSEKQGLFLAKLALCLVNIVGDAADAEEAIAAASRDL